MKLYLDSSAIIYSIEAAPPIRDKGLDRIACREIKIDLI